MKEEHKIMLSNGLTIIFLSEEVLPPKINGKHNLYSNCQPMIADSIRNGYADIGNKGMI